MAQHFKLLLATTATHMGTSLCPRGSISNSAPGDLKASLDFILGPVLASAATWRVNSQLEGLSLYVHLPLSVLLPVKEIFTHPLQEPLSHVYPMSTGAM